MGKVLSILLSLLFATSLSASAQTGSIWCFGYHNGINFNTEPPTLFRSAGISIGPSAVICDSLGRLLYYTDGINVYNGQGEIIHGGDSIGGTNPDPAGQTALILQAPDNDQKYYLFLTEYIPNPNRNMNMKLTYSIINRNPSSNIDSIFPKNTVLLKGKIAKLTAIKRPDNKSYWIIVKTGLDSFYSYQLDSSGIHLVTVSKIQLSADCSIIKKYNSLDGNLKASHDGKLLVDAFQGYANSYYTGDPNGFRFTGYILINFDEITGKCTTEFEHILYPDTTRYLQHFFQDAVFSPNDSLIYITDRDASSADGNNCYPILQIN